MICKPTYDGFNVETRLLNPFTTVNLVSLIGIIFCKNFPIKLLLSYTYPFKLIFLLRKILYFLEL